MGGFRTLVSRELVARVRPCRPSDVKAAHSESGHSLYPFGLDRRARSNGYWPPGIFTRQPDEELQDFGAPQLPPDDNPASSIDPVNLEHRLRDIQTNRSNLDYGWLPQMIGSNDLLLAR